MDDQKIRVFAVDDTVVYRRILADVVEGLEEAELVGTAPNGRLALARLEQMPVDLVLLDVEMPEMDGMATLRQIRRRFPAVSVVMVSGANLSSAEITMRCLEQGALDFLHKPDGADPGANREALRARLRPLLRHVRTRASLRRDPAPAPARLPVRTPIPPPPVPTPPAPARMAETPSRFDVVAIGISTGGPTALQDVIPRLPADFPVPILLVQHMPPAFTASLAEHLDQRSKLTVREARDGEPLRPGRVFIAPGGRHMVVRRLPDPDGGPGELIVGLNDNPPENSCRPSVDVLFRSLAAQFDGNLLAVVMTGMGSDGCEGVRAMKRRGCLCLTQTEDTCVVYGMPMAVDEAGLSDQQVSLGRIADRIVQLVRRSGNRFGAQASSPGALPPAPGGRPS
jgi:two-component system chemotaxis response regulator CheB